ncbi:MAG: 16S rRNA (cytosine(967)-C(5))-methyltransferase RsmB [Candidatus Cloacimonetes bacterium]|nr:16S rRNA (cytosine(967)-C(5))-methyltransferase RsmB [Candidatus Cloacimonadota bacterium]
MDFRLEAHKILIKVLIKNVFSDKLLNLTRSKFKDDKQSYDLLFRLVKGVIKMHIRLDFIASSHTDKVKFSKTDKKIKILFYSSLYQIIYLDSIPDHAAVNETVDLAKKQFNPQIAKFVNAVLRSYLRNPQITLPTEKVNKISVKYSYPVELINKWINLWGEDHTEQLCRYFNETSHLNIRVNSFATNSDKLIEYFKRRNIVIDKSKATSNILISDNPTGVLQDIAFQEGYFSIQDPSAALVVELADPRLGDIVLDLFAAPGGKATYTAELMQDTGEIFAVDKIPAKIKLLKQNLERLQLKSIKVFTKDAFEFGPIAPSFDKVFLDVPCSGWGVFQKKAELRWQIHQKMDKLLKLQEQSLKRGSQFVKDGGFLIYSTCTMNPKENEKQIYKFLEKHKEFKLVNASEKINEIYVNNHFLQIDPFEHQMDGAFAAKMQKV